MKPTKVCTLTPEQMPEIRGFRLGGSLQDLVNKYPANCKLNREMETDYSVDMVFNIPKENNSEVKDCSGSIYYYYDKNQYPEFSGIWAIRLNYDKNYLSKIEIEYDSTTDEQIKETFAEKIKQSLNLDQWSNWEKYDFTEQFFLSDEGEKVDSKYADFLNKDKFRDVSITTYKNTLDCNKASLSSELLKRTESTQTTYMPRLTLKANIDAIRKEQRDSEADKKYQQEKEKDKGKAETFNP